ncbi:putative Transcription factor domain-containing protein [Seiridium cardinale]|uniref:Transcription factor domain-containing protein n=1 Tax=Seiridium cardinale TaxID=138064 RepID=A0ABR2XWT7_9PEZI
MPDRPPSAGGAEKPPSLSVAKPNHIPACDRCRNFKKKCSRTFPVCSLCASAGTKCSFSTPASSSDAQTHHLRARVDWLTSYINQALPLAAPGIETIETGAELSEIVQWISTNAALSQGQSPPSAISGSQNVLLSGHQLMVDHRGLEPGVEGQTARASPGHQSIVRQSPEAFTGGSQPPADGTHVINQRLPPNAAARRFVDAYFRNVNRAYPFVDRNKVLNDLETLGDFPQRKQDADSTLLYLIMAIGCTTLQRAGQVPVGTTSKFEVAYPDIIQECLCRESIESIQILVLLALYSLFDPLAPSAWSLVSIAARQAMLLGLTRRSSDGRSMSAAEIELRHRLLWSIYVLDRMMATSLGLPTALNDENMDVPLPGLTVDEFASPDRSQFASILQTSRHVITLRQIEGRILDQVHLLKQSKISSLTHADRRSILQDMRADIENWYSNGCLVSPLEPDNVPIHNSITWLSARYYYLLILLYYPTQFNSSGCVVSKAELLRFAQKHVQSSSVLFQQRQLPLNRVTLFRAFPVGLVLMHGFVACAVECSPYPAREEVTMLISILEAFPEEWLDAHRASRTLRQFLTITRGVGDYGALQFSNAAFVSGQIASTRESALNIVRPAISGFTELMQDVLGKTTCYASLENTEERTSGRLGSFASHSSPGGTGSGTMAGISGVAGSDGSDMNYGWPGSLDLDFL